MFDHKSNLGEHRQEGHATFDPRHPASGDTAFETHVFEHRIIEGAEARVHYWRPRRKVWPRGVIIFFPGNPGLLGYYESFLTQLHASIPDDFAIVAHSHIGHSPDLPQPARALTLREQIRCKQEFVQCISTDLDGLNCHEAAMTTASIAVMGHSVGAYMAAEVSNSVNVKAAFLLFPTLGNIAQTQNGRRLRPIFHEPLISILPQLARILPLLLPMYRMLPLTGSLAPNETTLELLSSPATIYHVLGLGLSEMDNILEPNWEWYSDSKNTAKLWSYWGEDDGWVGREGVELQEIMRKVAGDGHVFNCQDSIPHAYCLEHSEQIAAVVSSWVTHAFEL